MERQEEICTGILKIIHDRSAAGCLVRSQDILTELKDKDLLEGADMDEKTYLETIIRQMLQDNQDLRQIAGQDGASCYYSIQSMSETYAGILAGKAEDPHYLIAQVVRENSRIYPRPVPLVSFGEPPFDLTTEMISACLAALGTDEAYRDIRQTVTSVGTTFLYSSLHLDPDYADMLAEWIDVGQVDNP